MHWPVEEQVRVQRLPPPGVMARQSRGEAHWPSETQGSSSCRPVPPLVLLLVEVEVEVDVDVDVDEEDDAPPVPELLDDAPPVPELLVLPPAPLELDPVSGGTHWALTLQV
jgi:hypothetical protein